MRSLVAIAALALAASIAGGGYALADPVYVWRPSEGQKAGQILPATAFAPPPEMGGSVDFRSSEYGQFPNYTTRSVALAIGDFLSVPVPAAFGFNGCRVLNDTANRAPSNWVSVSIAGVAGKYNVAIQAVASGRLQLTVMCATKTGADVETLLHEYLDLTIS